MQIYNVSGASNVHRALVLRDSKRILELAGCTWGTPLSSAWSAPELVAAPQTEHLPAADIASLYVPGVLVANERAAHALQDDLIEFLPAVVGKSNAFILNPLCTVHRLREAGAKLLRAGAAIVVLESADFYSSDIPLSPPAFWFHDGNAPRFLLCTECFVQRAVESGLSGVTFTRIGQATGDA